MCSYTRFKSQWCQTVSLGWPLTGGTSQSPIPFLGCILTVCTLLINLTLTKILSSAPLEKLTFSPFVFPLWQS